MEKQKIWGHYDAQDGKYLKFYHEEEFSIERVQTPYIELNTEEWKQAYQNPQGTYRVINGSHSLYINTTEEQAAIDLRRIKNQRTILLKESDWVVLPHSPITGSKLEEWVTYRQELRDVTNQTPPYVLPTKPE